MLSSSYYEDELKVNPDRIIKLMEQEMADLLKFLVAQIL